MLGIFTVLGGSLLYTFVKMSENAQVANTRPRELEMSSSSRV